MSSAPSIEDIYPLSPMQQGMLFHLLDEPEAGLNVIQMSCALRGSLDVDAFRRALGRVIERHAVLRTSFLWEEVDQPLQVVDREVPVPLAVEDWSGLGVEERRHRLEEYLESDLARGFDLTQAPLMRMLLAREEADLHRLVWSIQLILFDGWSLPAVIGEVLFHYEAFRAGDEPRLPTPRRYRDYIAWLLQREAGDGERFWRRELAGFTEPTPLPGDRGPGRRPAMAQRRVFLPEPDTAALQALARRERLTLNTVVQAAWALLLARAGGLDEVVFGATVSGRPHDLPGVEGMIGLFINTLPVRVRLDPGGDPVEWLRGLQERQSEARQHEHVPLVDVQGWSEVPRGLPLFESIVVFENYPVSEAVAGGRGTLELDEIRVLDANSYPLTLEIQPGARLSLRLTYDGSRFDLRTIEELLSRLGDLLRQLAAGGARLSDLLLTAAERQQLAKWNDTAVPRPPGLSLHGLFLARAATAPDAVALSFEGAGVSYGELRRRAGLLARRLRSLGCGPETRAAVALERSPELVIALLGVLESGAAYVPLDPEQPAERLGRMLEDARPVALLTRADLLPRLPETAVPTLLFAGEEPGRRSPGEPPALGDDDQLAYVIFTSGSTGRPKASMLHHRGIVNRLLWMAETYGLSPADVVLQKTPVGFDVSVWELFTPLATGGRLVLARPDGHREPDYLAGLIAREGVTVLHFVASMLRSYLDTPDLPACPSPRLLVASGEALTADLVARYGGRFPAAALENLYGPTETSVEVSAWSCAGQEDGPVPIGHPVANVRLHLIGRHGEPAAVGAPGELWIAGVAVGRGYLGRPDLTAERFVPDPFPGLPGDRGYRTGDLARRRPDGAIEFLGRIDQQVKIRGFRIEPEEIAAVLTSHPAVRQAVVMAVEGDGGGPRLVAWVVAKDGDGAGVAELRQHLRGHLPEPMVPELIVPLAALPLTASGKVDRRALPLPETWDGGAAAGEHVAPRNGFEEILADIWAAVLGRERVGAQDDFFALGGHSLLGVQVISRVRAAFGVELPVRALFNARTIAGLAALVEEATRGGAAPLPPLVAEPRGEGGLPLSFAQQRLWFLHQLDPDSTAYNMPVAVRLAGELDRPALERALREVVRRHEALRTTFRQVDGRAVQVIAPWPDLALPLVDLAGLGTAREAEALRLATSESRRPFDLERGPLFRPVLLRVAAGDHIVSATMHHIVSDERSLEVFVREVTALYAAFGTGLPSRLPELPVQYGDYAVWQRRWLAGAAMEGELAFWRRELQGLPPVLELPADRPRPEVRSTRGGSLDRDLGAAPATRLRDLARELGATPFMVALAAYQAFLGRFAGVEDLAVGVPVAGRTLQEVEDLIGFFVNTL
ncbi:MAG TPA: amino acid adenylation domain-containing protein, partial [Thermoanaerobaculia bacterium]|nr:amino acid adenylation domain-containing protein [Thermoanaerobaculia bacterium]